MKTVKSILFLSLFTLALVGCREVKEETDEDGDIENTIEEGVDEVQENTGTGGTDDN